MVDAEIIAQRLERLKNYVKQLRLILRAGKTKTVKNPITSAAMERYLQLAVECTLDVGNHIIAGSNFRKPATYSHIMQILFDENILTKKLFNSARPIASIRGLLVHDYSEIDKGKLFDSTKEIIPVFEDLAKVYQKYL